MDTVSGVPERDIYITTVVDPGDDSVVQIWSRMVGDRDFFPVGPPMGAVDADQLLSLAGRDVVVVPERSYG